MQVEKEHEKGDEVTFSQFENDANLFCADLTAGTS